MTPSQARIPLIGAWKLTKCESSHPQLPHPTLQLATFAEAGDVIHYTADSAYSDGRTVKVSADLTLDGAWRPVTGSQLADSLSIRRHPDGSYEVGMRKAGADAGVSRFTISSDGRTLDGVWEIAGPGGVAITWKTTSERQ